jgi:hypothetical protein
LVLALTVFCAAVFAAAAGIVAILAGRVESTARVQPAE